jgi:hypothetical protein
MEPFMVLQKMFSKYIRTVQVISNYILFKHMKHQAVNWFWSAITFMVFWYRAVLQVRGPCTG